MNLPLLNPYQKNSVQTTLRRLERSLQTISSSLTQPETGILLKIEDGLEANQKEALKQEIPPILYLINLLAERFGLNPEPQPLGQRIASLLSSSIVELDDIRSESLTRYGPVSPELQPELEPYLKTLRTHLKRMEQVLK